MSNHAAISCKQKHKKHEITTSTDIDCNHSHYQSVTILNRRRNRNYIIASFVNNKIRDRVTKSILTNAIFHETYRIKEQCYITDFKQKRSEIYRLGNTSLLLIS